jgi:hypothetical protein
MSTEFRVFRDREWDLGRACHKVIGRHFLLRSISSHLALSRCEPSIGSVRQISRVLRTNLVLDGS